MCNKRRGCCFWSGIRVQGCNLQQVNIYRAHLPQTFTLWASRSRSSRLGGPERHKFSKGSGMTFRNFHGHSPVDPEPELYHFGWFRQDYTLPDFDTMALWAFHISHVNRKVHEECQRMLAPFSLFIATLFKAQLLRQAFLANDFHLISSFAKGCCATAISGQLIRHPSQCIFIARLH